MADIAVALLRCKKSSFGSDTGNRINEFETAVSQSKAMMARIRSDLQMVVAPEYFFSPVDQIGQNYKQDGPVAISRTQKHDLYSELKGVSSRNGGVIIVAGSIFYKKGDVNDVKGLNVCPVLRNGKILYKYYKKFDDGALNKGITGATYHHKDTDPTFSIGGVRFGIEICGDHNAGVNNLKSWLTAHNNPVVDVQILISDSMTPSASRMAARANGYFIQCDLNGETAAALGIYQSGATGVWPAPGLATSLTPNITFESGPDMAISIYLLTNA